MADPTSSPKSDSPKPGKSSSSLMGKLLGLFKKTPKPLPPRRKMRGMGSPKKGHSSFLQNFKVKEIKPETGAQPGVASEKPADPQWSRHLEEDVPQKSPVEKEAPAKRPTTETVVPESTIIGKDLPATSGARERKPESRLPSEKPSPNTPPGLAQAVRPPSQAPVKRTTTGTVIPESIIVGKTAPTESASGKEKPKPSQPEAKSPTPQPSISSGKPTTETVIPQSTIIGKEEDSGESVVKSGANVPAKPAPKAIAKPTTLSEPSTGQGVRKEPPVAPARKTTTGTVIPQSTIVGETSKPPQDMDKEETKGKPKTPAAASSPPPSQKKTAPPSTPSERLSTGPIVPQSTIIGKSETPEATGTSTAKPSPPEKETSATPKSKPPAPPKTSSDPGDAHAPSRTGRATTDPIIPKSTIIGRDEPANEPDQPDEPQVRERAKGSVEKPVPKATIQPAKPGRRTTGTVIPKSTIVGPDSFSKRTSEIIRGGTALPKEPAQSEEVASRESEKKSTAEVIDRTITQPVPPVGLLKRPLKPEEIPPPPPVKSAPEPAKLPDGQKAAIESPLTAPQTVFEPAVKKAVPEPPQVETPPAVSVLLPGQKKGTDTGKPLLRSQPSVLPIRDGSQVSRATELLPSHPGGAFSHSKKPTGPEEPVEVKKPSGSSHRDSPTSRLKKESLRLKPAEALLAKASQKPKAPATEANDLSSTREGKPGPQTTGVVYNVRPQIKNVAPPAHKPPVTPAQPKPVPPSPSPKQKGDSGQPAVLPAGSKAKPKVPASTRAEKKKPKVVLPPMREKPKRKVPVLVLVPVAILLLGVIGFLLYWFQRETAVQVRVYPGETTLQNQAYIVMNFSGKLQLLRNDYLRRRQPVLEEIERIRANIAAAENDLAGRRQRQELLNQALEDYRNEIPAYLDESQQSLRELWEVESRQLSESYDAFKEQLHQQIEARAASLGVAYQRNPEIDAIAVAVNAFRLALYGAAGDIDVSRERIWAEGILQEWNAFEESWREQQKEIKKKALKIKKEPVPKIAETRRQIDGLERDLEAVEIDINALQSEIERNEGLLMETRQRLADIDTPFFEELTLIPDQFKLETITIPPSGTFRLGDLQEHEDLSEGTHFLLVRAENAEQQFWAVEEFEILPYQEVNVSISADQFMPLNQVLVDGLFMQN